MKIIRALLILYLPVLLLTPFASAHLIRENNRAFEAEQQRYIAQYGTSEGLYGDCSGASLLVPVLIGALAIPFFVWALITLILSGTASKTASLVQLILLSFFTIVFAWWSLICFLR